MFSVWSASAAPEEVRCRKHGVIVRSPHFFLLFYPECCRPDKSRQSATIPTQTVHNKRFPFFIKKSPGYTVTTIYPGDFISMFVCLIFISRSFWSSLLELRYGPSGYRLKYHTASWSLVPFRPCRLGNRSLCRGLLPCQQGDNCCSTASPHSAKSPNSDSLTGLWVTFKPR